MALHLDRDVVAHASRLVVVKAAARFDIRGLYLHRVRLQLPVSKTHVGANKQWLSCEPAVLWPLHLDLKIKGRCQYAVVFEDGTFAILGLSTTLETFLYGSEFTEAYGYDIASRRNLLHEQTRRVVSLVWSSVNMFATGHPWRRPDGDKWAGLVGIRQPRRRRNIREEEWVDDMDKGMGGLVGEVDASFMNGDHLTEAPHETFHILHKNMLNEAQLEQFPKSVRWDCALVEGRVEPPPESCGAFFQPPAVMSGSEVTGQSLWIDLMSVIFAIRNSVRMKSYEMSLDEVIANSKTKGCTADMIEALADQPLVVKAIQLNMAGDILLDSPTLFSTSSYGEKLYGATMVHMSIERRRRIFEYRLQILSDAIDYFDNEARWANDLRMYYVLIVALIFNCFAIVIKNLGLRTV